MAVDQTGRSFPLGATVFAEGANFSVFSRRASRVELLLFDDAAAPQPARVIETRSAHAPQLSLLARFRARRRSRTSLRISDTLARLVAALPSRDWRFGAGCAHVRRLLARSRAELVAGAAARPDGYGNSLYQGLSSFAGNELLISPEGLINDGLLRSSDCEAASFTASLVEYDTVIPFKRRILETAWRNFCAGRTQNCRPPMSSSSIFTPIGWKITPVPCTESQTRRRL